MIEVLVTLAIVSIVSVLIFASLGTQVRQVEAVDKAASEILDSTAQNRLIGEIVSNSVEAWPEESDAKFRGARKSLTGLSTHGLLDPVGYLQPYAIQIVQSGGSESVEVSTAEGQWSLEDFDTEMEFRYLGQDGIWYEQWPPPEQRTTTLREIEDSLRNKALPEIVGLVSQEDQEPLLLLAIPLKNSHSPFVRVRDLVDTGSDFP